MVSNKPSGELTTVAQCNARLRPSQSFISPAFVAAMGNQRCTADCPVCGAFGHPKHRKQHAQWRKAVGLRQLSSDRGPRRLNSLRYISRFLLAFLLLILLFPAPAINAQTELNQLINALQAKYNKLSSLAADFTQIYTAPGERTRRESGRVLLKKPGRMRWDYTSPETKLFVSDGKWVYEYVPAEGYATRSSVKESDDLRAPFAFLLGRGNLRRDFKRIEFASEAPAKAGNKVLRMVPKRTQDFTELLIEVEPAGLQLSRLSLIESNGARSDFLFSNVRENAPAGAEQFIFKAPAGVEVRNND